MRRRLILFSVIIVLPAIALSYLSWRALRQEQAERGAEVRSRATASLRATVLEVEGELREIRERWWRSAGTDVVAADGKDGVSVCVRSADGRMVHPRAPEPSPSLEERIRRESPELAGQLERAVELEFAENRRSDACGLYLEMESEIESLGTRAALLHARARSGDPEEARAAYERLAREFGSMSSESGIPYGVVAAARLLEMNPTTDGREAFVKLLAKEAIPGHTRAVLLRGSPEYPTARALELLEDRVVRGEPGPDSVIRIADRSFLLTFRETAAAAEAIRAKSAFRLAWCLEKKGQKVDAERGYREVTTKYASQSEVAQKARERLDRLVSGNGGNGAPVSMSERIAGLILELGGKGCEEAVRTLVLLGEPTIPALRQALGHKDPTLAGMAACALVQLEQDSGTYAALERGLRKGAQQSLGSNVYARYLATLIQRQEGYRKDFIESFRKSDDESVLDDYLEVLGYARLPELDGRLDDLLCSGPLSNRDKLVRKMGEVKEERFLSLLGRLEKAPAGDDRALSLLTVDGFKLSDVGTYCRHLLALFPKDPPRLDLIARFASPAEILQRCAETWLRDGMKDTRDFVIHGIYGLGPGGIPLSCTLFEADLDESLRWSLLANATQFIGECKDDKVRASLEKALWKAVENPKWRSLATDTLWKMVPESHPRWEDVVRLVVLHTEAAKEFERLSPEGMARVRRIVDAMTLEGKPEERQYALRLIEKIGDDSRFEVLSKVALDEKSQSGLRQKAVRELGRCNEFARVRPTFEKLLKDKDLGIRREAVNQLCNCWRQEPEGLLAPLVEDSDFQIRYWGVEFFARAPRQDFLDPLIKALRDSNVGIRRIATSALGRAESLKAVPHIIKKLRDDDEHVRAAARAAHEAINKHAEEVEEWNKWYEGVKGK